MTTRRDPVTRRPAQVQAPPAARRRSGSERERRLDDQWAGQLTAYLRKAAEAREQRERDRAREDERTTRREAAAILALIGDHDQPVPGALSALPSREARRSRRS